MQRVRLLAGVLRERQQVNGRHLRAIDSDRLLAVYRPVCGLPAKAEAYGGWETRDIAGHSLGHCLSALAYHFAATGEVWAQERVARIVQELEACRVASGDDGVVAVGKPGLLDLRRGKVESSPFMLNGCWVPFYALHKLFAGLRDAYRFTENEQALEIERRLAEWVERLFEGFDAAQVQAVLRAEHGGMKEVLVDLAADTGDARFMRMAEETFHHAAVLDPLLAGEDNLNGLHGNTYIPKVIGVAREYEARREPRLARAAEFFWDNVVQRRSYATGGHGEREHFFPPADFPRHLTPYACETCNSYNMLKLTSHLFAWAPDEGAARMDFTERALFNHLAANLGRREGEYGYFLGLGGVAVKVFSTPYDSWWCCVGTGLENPARYGEQFYFEDGDALWVNLYAASTVTSRDGAFTLTQETQFPCEDSVRLAVRCAQPVKLALKLRHPGWCERLEVKLNGEPWPAKSQPSSYLTIKREWRDGDLIELHLPMRLRCEPLPHSERKQLALMFGPLLLAAVVPPDATKPDPAKERWADHLLARGKTDEFPPVFVAESEEALIAGLEPTSTFGHFVSRGVVAPDDLHFMPLLHVYEEHYAVYLPRLTPDEWCREEADLRAQQTREAELVAATLDAVEPGQQQPEVEHQLAGEKTEPYLLHHRHGREVAPGGWCEYRLRCDSTEPMAVVATYWGMQWVAAEFEWQVDGVSFAEESIRNNRPGDFFAVAYSVPSELTAGKTQITLRLQVKATSGGPAQLFGLKFMRAVAIAGDVAFVKPPSVG